MYRCTLRQSCWSAVPRRPCRVSRASRLSRHASSQGAPPLSRSRGRGLVFISVLAISAGVAWYFYPTAPAIDDATKGKGPLVPQAEIEFERQRKEPSSREDNRGLISSQHLQVKKSWENPGVYAWGSNSGKVVAPESKDAVVKTPRRIPYFDGMLLRDLKLDRNFGVAVTEEGDIVQWGTAFSPTATTPIRTLAGKDISKVAISNDRIIALSKGGTVYSLPVAHADQQAGAKAEESSWLPFWSGSSSISYRTLQPDSLGYGERVADISSGLEHCLLLTSKGRVFAAASSTENYPAKGQLGIPGLTWLTKPRAQRFDQPHEVRALPSVGVSQIATGNYHSLALDKDSKVYAWGDNSSGQLGLEVDPENPAVDSPTAVPLQKLYRRALAGARPSVTSIAAGGANSYFTVESVTPPPAPGGRVTADTWACGEGIYGSLGTGKWTHISSGPTKIKALSGLFEYDEAARSVVPIRLARLSVGSTHAAAVMDNITSVGTGSAAGAAATDAMNATNWGADVVWWGGNEFYQLGTGRRSNINEPTYIPPLDGGKADAEHGRKGEVHRFQITPKQTVRLGEGGKGRRVSLEQRIECGRYVSAVYSATA